MESIEKLNQQGYDTFKKTNYKLKDGSTYSGEMRVLSRGKNGKAVVFIPYGKGKLVIKK